MMLVSLKTFKGARKDCTRTTLGRNFLFMWWFGVVWIQGVLVRSEDDSGSYIIINVIFLTRLC